MHWHEQALSEKVSDARKMVDVQNGEGEPGIVEFKAQVSRHESIEKTSRIQASQTIRGSNLIKKTHIN